MVLVYERLVIKRFLLGITGEGCFNLFANHSLTNFGIVGDGLQGDVRHGFVSEPATNSFCRMCKLVVVEVGGHQALLGESNGDAGGIASDPAAPPLFGNISGRTGTTSRVKN